MTDTRRNLLLWVAVLAAPTIWLCSFQALFTLAPWACIFQMKLALYAVSIAALILEALTAALAWSQWKALGQEWACDAGGSLARARLMAISGVVFSIGFGLIILAQAIPEVMLGACE